MTKLQLAKRGAKQKAQGRDRAVEGGSPAVERPRNEAAPVAPELAEHYKSGTLAFVHPAGIPDANRSHFAAIGIMDHGASLAHIERGWLARYLSQSKQRAMGIPGVSALGSFAGEFSGFDAAFSIADNASGIPLPWHGCSCDRSALQVI